MQLYKVPFLCGDGSPDVMLDVAYIADFPRDENSRCAFCHGDPCDQSVFKRTEIHAYYVRNPRAETCPCCLGRPS